MNGIVLSVLAPVWLLWGLAVPLDVTDRGATALGDPAVGQRVSEEHQRGRRSVQHDAYSDLF